MLVVKGITKNMGYGETHAKPRKANGTDGNRESGSGNACAVFVRRRPLEQRGLVGGRFAVVGGVVGESEVVVGVAGGLSALAGADDEADLQ